MILSEIDDLEKEIKVLAEERDLLDPKWAIKYLITVGPCRSVEERMWLKEVYKRTNMNHQLYESLIWGAE